MNEMQYVAHGAGGAPQILTVARAAIPTPAADEVLIRVAYAGVNRPDCLQRSGLYPPPANASPILGLECAGEIVALGANVTDVRVGDQVCALCNGGAYAQYVGVPAAQILPIPRGLSLREAASLPENWFTVFHNVSERGGLKLGETILIHGGTSGIGLAAIQFAKSIGADVITTVGNAEKAAFVQKFGASAIQYKTQDFVKETALLTLGRGVDVILDMVGGDYIPRNLACLAEDGRLVQIAFLQGSKAEINFRDLMVKRLTITGSTLRPRSPQFKADLAQSLLQKIWPQLEAKAITPVIHATYRMHEAAQAHALMESNAHIGKIMLEIAA